MNGRVYRIVVGMSAITALLLSGCSSSGDSPADSPAQTAESPTADVADEPPAEESESSSDTPELTGTLSVFAAASLKATFDQLREDFMAAHPSVTIPEITYDGSSTLVTQITEGAPADVFASADEANMDKIADLVTGRVDFATNTLVIAVAPGNPKGIASLADLARDDVVTVICSPEVPCGAASQRALNAAGVALTPASEEQNVTSVLTKVRAGEADAGLVYATDVNSAAGEVDGVDFPQAAEAVNTYPIAILADSANAAAAQAFVDLVTGASGQSVLAAAGFGKP